MQVLRASGRNASLGAGGQEGIGGPETATRQLYIGEHELSRIIFCRVGYAGHVRELESDSENEQQKTSSAVAQNFFLSRADLVQPLNKVISIVHICE
jgi:hypothetical protein